MTPVRTRNVVVVCLLVSLATSGCTSRMAGRAFGHILVGVIGAVAHAAASGAFQGGSGRASYDVPPPLSPCEAELARWQEVHQDPAEIPPAHLQCASNGDWPNVPEASVAAGGERPADDPPAARTDVPTAVCGGTETDEERCEAQRAAREQQERERKAAHW